ncbi:MAG: glucosyltransferase domain-containing protein [Francisella endosymbiont of Hyalomma scupense]
MTSHLYLNHNYEKLKNYLVSITYLFLSIGIYQSFIILFAERVIFLLILDQLNNVRPNLKDITDILIKILFVPLAALIGYFLISKLTSIYLLVNLII